MLALGSLGTMRETYGDAMANWHQEQGRHASGAHAARRGVDDA